MMRTTLNELKDSKRNIDALEIVANACKYKNQFAWDPIDTKEIKKACERNIGDWRDELEQYLLNRGQVSYQDLMWGFCGNGLKTESITRACYNVDPRLYEDETVFPKHKEGFKDK